MKHKILLALLAVLVLFSLQAIDAKPLELEASSLNVYLSPGTSQRILLDFDISAQGSVIVSTHAENYKSVYIDSGAFTQQAFSAPIQASFDATVYADANAGEGVYPVTIISESTTKGVTSKAFVTVTVHVSRGNGVQYYTTPGTTQAPSFENIITSSRAIQLTRADESFMIIEFENTGALGDFNVLVEYSGEEIIAQAVDNISFTGNKGSIYLSIQSFQDSQYGAYPVRIILKDLASHELHTLTQFTVFVNPNYFIEVNQMLETQLAVGEEKEFVFVIENKSLDEITLHASTSSSFIELESTSVRLAPLASDTLTITVLGTSEGIQKGIIHLSGKEINREILISAEVLSIENAQEAGLISSLGALPGDIVASGYSILTGFASAMSNSVVAIATGLIVLLFILFLYAGKNEGLFKTSKAEGKEVLLEAIKKDIKHTYMQMEVEDTNQQFHDKPQA